MADDQFPDEKKCVPPPTTVAVTPTPDIEHATVIDDPRKWSRARKVSRVPFNFRGSIGGIFQRITAMSRMLAVA